MPTFLLVDKTKTDQITDSQTDAKIRRMLA